MRRQVKEKSSTSLIVHQIKKKFTQNKEKITQIRRKKVHQREVKVLTNTPTMTNMTTLPISAPLKETQIMSDLLSVPFHAILYLDHG